LAPPDPLAGFKVPTSRGGEEWEWFGGGIRARRGERKEEERKGKGHPWFLLTSPDKK